MNPYGGFSTLFLECLEQVTARHVEQLQGERTTPTIKTHLEALEKRLIAVQTELAYRLKDEAEQ